MLRATKLHRPGLAPANLVLKGGQITCLRGASGSGKTLLLRALADLDPNDGEVDLDGLAREAVSGPQWRARVAYVAAEPGWWGHCGDDHFSQPPTDLLARLGLSQTLLRRPIADLSTGERRRLALIRTLIGRPPVLLLDEPTSGLDPQATTQVEELLIKEKDNGTAILLATHDHAQAQRLGQAHYVMEAGELRENVAP